ncbi:MAG: tetratricopeptide (TPR) repeat protein [Myxococcota bacterium]|jgi:tetratricopeptide (TPR) repeat protein
MGTDGWLRRLGWLLIVALVALVYAGTLDAPFVYDDKIEVIGNTTIRFLDQWRAILLYNVSRALLLLSYAINFHYSALEPQGYHLTNIAIHALGVGAAMLLGESVGRLSGQKNPLRIALLAAAVWAVHPMGTEAVTYITGRSESLCALFCFTSLFCWSEALRTDNSSSRAGWRILGIVAFFGAALTKEVGAVVPAAALAMEVMLGDRRLLRTGWLWYLGFVVLIGGAAWARWETTGVLLPREVDRPLGVQLTTQAEVWLRYLQLWLLPTGQTIYHHILDSSLLSGRGLLSLTGLGALVAGAVWWGRQRPAVGWALLCAALFLLPSSAVSLKESMAEHRAYQTGLWLALAIGWSIPASAHRIAAIVALVALLPLSLATAARNAVWDSEVTLWKEAVEHHPDSSEAWYGLGDAYRFARALDAATESYQEAVVLDPTYLDAWNNLGISRAEVGDRAGAETAWRSALRVSPSYCKAHNNLGHIAFRHDEFDTAVAEFNSTLAYCPDNVQAHYGLGNIFYSHRREREKAAHHYGQVVSLDPNFVYAAEVRRRLLELTW